MTNHPHDSDTATPEPTYYQVIWGPDENDRITYPDHHDGTHISETAEGRATAKFLERLTEGVPTGFYINGAFNAGTDITADHDQSPAT